MQNKQIIHDFEKVQTDTKEWEKKMFVARIDVY